LVSKITLRGCQARSREKEKSYPKAGDKPKGLKENFSLRTIYKWKKIIQKKALFDPE